VRMERPCWCRPASTPGPLSPATNPNSNRTRPFKSNATIQFETACSHDGAPGAGARARAADHQPTTIYLVVCEARVSNRSFRWIAPARASTRRSSPVPRCAAAKAAPPPRRAPRCAPTDINKRCVHDSELAETPLCLNALYRRFVS
jgi:hypothetical protein